MAYIVSSANKQHERRDESRLAASAHTKEVNKVEMSRDRQNVLVRFANIRYSAWIGYVSIDQLARHGVKVYLTAGSERKGTFSAADRPFQP